MIYADQSFNYFVQVSEKIGRRWTPLQDRQPIHDPFVHTTIAPRGWRAALAVLLGTYRVFVQVTGTDEAHHAVFGYDYTPRQPRWVGAKPDQGDTQGVH